MICPLLKSWYKVLETQALLAKRHRSKKGELEKKVEKDQRLASIEEEITQINLKKSSPGLWMNILRAGNKLPVQRVYFTNSAGNLLPALEFLGRLCNFCNLVIIFSLM